jgi:hypothetical protein
VEGEIDRIPVQPVVTSESRDRSGRWPRVLVGLLGAWLGLSTAAVTAVALLSGRPVMRAVVLMGLGLILLWVVAAGGFMWLQRDRIRAAVLSIPIGWKLRFVLFATLLALIEEAITTTMTNLAPFFGVAMGQAYITASTNYLDVVGLHSVIVFVPMFIAWSWLLQRYAFSPSVVFLLFGLTGTLAEASFGPQHLAEIGLWTFVYGLMVYLPAYSIPSNRGASKPSLHHYLWAVVLPFLFAMPVAALVGVLHPIRIHFPPIMPDT